jgi:hypothetical protein
MYVYYVSKKIYRFKAWVAGEPATVTIYSNRIAWLGRKTLFQQGSVAGELSWADLAEANLGWGNKLRHRVSLKTQTGSLLNIDCNAVDAEVAQQTALELAGLPYNPAKRLLCAEQLAGSPAALLAEAAAADAVTALPALPVSPAEQSAAQQPATPLAVADHLAALHQAGLLTQSELADLLSRQQTPPPIQPHQ